MTKKVSFRENVSSTSISNIDVSLTGPKYARGQRDNVVGILRVKRAPYTDYTSRVQSTSTGSDVSVTLIPPDEEIPTQQTSYHDDDSKLLQEEEVPGSETFSAPGRSSERTTSPLRALSRTSSPSRTPPRTPSPSRSLSRTSSMSRTSSWVSSPKSRPSTPLQDTGQAQQTSSNERYPERPSSGSRRASPERVSSIKSSKESLRQEASDTGVNGRPFTPPKSEHRTVTSPKNDTTAGNNTVHKNIFLRQKSPKGRSSGNIRYVHSRVKEDGRAFSPTAKKAFNESVQAQNISYDTYQLYTQDNGKYFPNKGQQNEQFLEEKQSSRSGSPVSSSSQRKSSFPMFKGSNVSSTTDMDKYKPQSYPRNYVPMRNNWTEKRLIKEHPNLFADGRSSEDIKIESKTMSVEYSGRRPSSGRKSPPLSYTRLKSKALGIRPRSAEVRGNRSSVLKHIYNRKTKAASSTQLDFLVNTSRDKRPRSPVLRKTSFSRSIQSARPVKSSHGSNSSIEASKPKTGKRISFASVQRRASARNSTADTYTKKEDLQRAHGDDTLRGKSPTRRGSASRRPSSANKKVSRTYVFHETNKSSTTHVDNEQGRTIADGHALRSEERKRQTDAKKTQEKRKSSLKSSACNVDGDNVHTKTPGHHDQTPTNKPLNKRKPSDGAGRMTSTPSKAKFEENKKFEVYMWDGSRSKLADKKKFHLTKSSPASTEAAPRKKSPKTRVKRPPLEKTFEIMQVLYNTPEFQVSMKTRPVRCFYVW